MGKGDFPLLLAPVFKDEVSVLIQAFGEMEHNLAQRDAELARKNEEVLQSRKLASLGTLAAGVAHELNNPVNNIYLAAQILSKELTPGSPGIFRETVEDIFSQTVRVKRIIGELLEFTREKLPDLGRINLTGVVDRVLCRMITSGAMKDVKINIRAPEVVEALADEHLIEQVFINLIGNAVEAMEGNGVLDIEIKAMDTYVAIKVSDTGKGILPEDMTRVFDPFFTTKEKGTGLGLAIVYSIIEKHKGKIEVKSEPGKGATFTVTLPEEQ
jgi:signal transduction histidine kinase